MLAGGLDVSLIHGFAESVQASDTFTVLYATNGIEGAFADVPSGGRVLTPERDSFAVYYGDNAATMAAGRDPKKITLTDFRRKPIGTLIRVN